MDIYIRNGTPFVPELCIAARNITKLTQKINKNQLNSLFVFFCWFLSASLTIFLPNDRDVVFTWFLSQWMIQLAHFILTIDPVTTVLRYNLKATKTTKDASNLTAHVLRYQGCNDDLLRLGGFLSTCTRIHHLITIQIVVQYCLCLLHLLMVSLAYFTTFLPFLSGIAFYLMFDVVLCLYAIWDWARQVWRYQVYRDLNRTCMHNTINFILTRQ
jgi:hypothetical protein